METRSAAQLFAARGSHARSKNFLFGPTPTPSTLRSPHGINFLLYIVYTKRILLLLLLNICLSFLQSLRQGERFLASVNIGHCPDFFSFDRFLSFIGFSGQASLPFAQLRRMFNTLYRIIQVYVHKNFAWKF